MPWMAVLAMSLHLTSSMSTFPLSVQHARVQESAIQVRGGFLKNQVFILNS